jgi:hypothetical protein
MSNRSWFFVAFTPQTRASYPEKFAVATEDNLQQRRIWVHSCCQIRSADITLAGLIYYLLLESELLHRCCWLTAKSCAVGTTIM